MTMTMPLTIDPAKNYKYTWPGQPPKMVSGAELADICKGSDPSQLSIEEVPETVRERRVPVPESSPKGER